MRRTAKELDIDKARGCMLGMVIGAATSDLDEKLESPHAHELVAPPTTKASFCVARALIKSGGRLDSFMLELAGNMVTCTRDDKTGMSTACLNATRRLADGASWETSGEPGAEGCDVVARSVPIGIYHDHEGKIAAYGLEASAITHDSDVARCAGAAAGIVTWLARKGVPTGLWSHELLLSTGGVCTEFERAVNKATSMAASGIEASLALGDGLTAHSAIANALFCCLRCGDDFGRAVRMSKGASACLAGGWMGARLGMKLIPEHWLTLPCRDMVMDMADDIMRSRKANKVENS